MSGNQKPAPHKTMGEAAEIRDHVRYWPEMNQELNKIVHSQDRNPHRYGPNPYAGVVRGEPRAREAAQVVEMASDVRDWCSDKK
jgi:hypothetical protein